MKRKGYFVLAILAACLSLIATAAAASPMTPCDDTTSVPAFPAPGATPAIAIFNTRDLADWQPGACIGWSQAEARKSKLVVAVAGSFTFDGPLDDLVARISAVSTIRDLKYWSTLFGTWRPMANEVSALSGPDPDKRRADFKPSEMRTGAQLYYWSTGRSGEGVTRLTVRERTADTVVVTADNVTPVKFLMLTLFPPGALQTAMVIKRLGPKHWGVYMLTRTSDQSSIFANSHAASYVNRAVALYRLMAGIRPDQDPPAMR